MKKFVFDFFYFTGLAKIAKNELRSRFAAST